MKRGRVLLALAVIGLGLGWVAIRGLEQNLVYYRTPTELVDMGPDGVGDQVRLGGLVVRGSVRDGGSSVRFLVSDRTTSMTVVGSGGVPSLFRGGQGVVVEGYLGPDGVFHADTVLVKHGSVYRPPAPGETPHRADVG